MLLTDTFPNQVRSESAVALEASADAGHFASIVGSHWDAIGGTPAEGAFGDPALLTIRRSNPNAGLAAGVMDFESPLGLEFLDVFVCDHGLAYGVDHNQVTLAQDELWTQPQCCSGNSEHAAGCDISDEICASAWVEDRLTEKESIENKCASTPDQIAFWAKNSELLHTSIIAGAPVDGEGK